MSAFTELENVAQISLGYKSLQNDFYYLNKATIETYGIEKKYLEPIVLFRELDSENYFQESKSQTWIFLCRDSEADLRGTGALKYIHAMADRPAAEKKQSSGGKTIRQVLVAQSGGLWYAPKAKPHPTRLWLRKAISSVYAPFVFKKSAVVDQRCNYIEPIDGIDVETLAAVLTSSIFAYSLEINGSASMGAGALEAPTSKLRGYPVLDVRKLGKKEVGQLHKLGNEVWDNESPIDWLRKPKPGRHLRALDKWLLDYAKSNLTLEQLYSDLEATCQARSVVANDKVRTSKKQKVESVGSVAEGIVESIRQLINSRQFPESFLGADGEGETISLGASEIRKITISPLLNEADIAVLGSGNVILYKGAFEAAVSEVIVRSLLLGRENFPIPRDGKIAARAVSEFLTWFDDIRGKLDTAINESALGTGYEDLLRAEVYERLGINPQVGVKVLPHEIRQTPKHG